MYYGEIKEIDIANGPGVRVSLFVSGCRHHCGGCFNPQTWDFQYGRPYTEETQNSILTLLEPSFIQGLTLLGGEPFEPENQPVVRRLVETVRQTLPAKDIWCYTGYTLERDLVQGGCAFTADTSRLLHSIDVLVDGEFIEAEKDISLRFRGSRNQRLLHREKDGRWVDIGEGDPYNIT